MQSPLSSFSFSTFLAYAYGRQRRISVGGARTAGASQRKTAEAHPDQPQNQRRDRPGAPAAGAETACGAAQMHDAQDQADEPQDQGDDGSVTPASIADKTG